MLLALALVASLAGLAVGPLLFALGRARALPLAALEGLSLGLVPALVLSRVAPHLVEEGGGAAVACLAAGYLALAIVERRSHRALATVGEVVAIPALALHAAADGVGLGVAVAAAGGTAAWLLGAGILLHRVPEGLTLARALVPEIGWRRTSVWLALLASATITGALVGERLLSILPHELFHAIVGVGVGAMLRLVTHSHTAGPATVSERGVAGVSFLLGIAVALLVPEPPEILTTALPGEIPFASAFVALLCDTAPFVLAGVFAAAALQAWQGRRPRAARGGGGRALVAAALEPENPARMLERAGEMMKSPPLVAGAVFSVLAVPALDLARVPATVRLLGLPLGLARWILAGSIAMVVAVLVAAVARPAPGESHAPNVHARAAPRAGEPGKGRLFAFALTEVDRLAPWYLGGLAVACAIEALGGTISDAFCRAPLDVVLGAVLAASVWLCPLGLAPVAAVLVHKGASPGAALAATLAGPGMSTALLTTTWKRLGGRAAAALALGVVALAVVAGEIANLVLAGAGVPDVHGLARGERGIGEVAAASVLGILMAAGVLRLGPRAWLSAVVVEATSPEHVHLHDETNHKSDQRHEGFGHDHAHAHDHDHDHGERSESAEGEEGRGR